MDERVDAGGAGGDVSEAGVTIDTASGGKRRYQAPRLTAYGDVRSLTLGGSPGPLDSGDSGTKAPFGG